MHNLVRAINIKTKDINEGAVDVYYDSKKVVNQMHKGLSEGIIKAIEGVQDGVASIHAIVKLIKKMKIRVHIYHTNGHPKGPATFQKYPGRFLIRKCNKIAKEA